jgi:hypothetical protein
LLQQGLEVRVRDELDTMPAIEQGSSQAGERMHVAGAAQGDYQDVQGHGRRYGRQRFQVRRNW